MDSNLLFEKFDIENSYPYSLLEKQIDIVLKKYYDTKSLIKLNTKKKLSEIDNKSLGRKKFVKVETKKSKDSKLVIKNLSKNFNGVFTDVEILKILKINRNTFYKYKKELLEEINNKNFDNLNNKKIKNEQDNKFLKDFFSMLIKKED